VIISEDKLRRLIREQFLNEKDWGDTSSLGGSSGSSSSSSSSTYTGSLVNKKGLKKYLGDPSTGMSPPGFWDNFRKDLENHIKKAYPELGIKIDNLGVTRDLKAAADAGGNKARVSGSKHGAGLAQDVYLHTKKYGKFSSYKKDNPKLAKDQKLVDAIIEFLEGSKYENIVYWGGAFSSGKASLSKGELPKDRGILEFHHFEFSNKDMPKYFENVKDELKKIGIDHNSLTNTKALANLYKKISWFLNLF